MKSSKLKNLSNTAQAIYLDEFQKIQGVLCEEAKLRGELARLQTQSETGRKQMVDNLSMQSVGADLLWQAWLVRSRQQLNIELSQVIARKLSLMGRVRKAFGRQNALQSIYESHLAERRTAKQKQSLESLLQRHLEP